MTEQEAKALASELEHSKYWTVRGICSPERNGNCSIEDEYTHARGWHIHALHRHLNVVLVLADGGAEGAAFIRMMQKY